MTNSTVLAKLSKHLQRTVLFLLCHVVLRCHVAHVALAEWLSVITPGKTGCEFETNLADFRCAIRKGTSRQIPQWGQTGYL